MSESDPQMTNAANAPEIPRDENGVSYQRKELNGHWVQYTFFDERGLEQNRIAMPRIEVFSAEDIARLDEMFAAEDADA